MTAAIVAFMLVPLESHCWFLFNYLFFFFLGILFSTYVEVKNQRRTLIYRFTDSGFFFRYIL